MKTPNLWIRLGRAHSFLSRCVAIDRSALGTELDYKLGRIDNPTNLNAQPVYIYSGALDTVVHRPVVVSLVDYYNIFHAKVETEFDILSGATPTRFAA